MTEGPGGSGLLGGAALLAKGHAALARAHLAKARAILAALGYPRPPHTVTTMLLLDAAAIRELQAAALSADLARSRDALLAGIDGAIVAGLRTAPNPAAQIMSDLDALNKTGALADDTVPLDIWIANAAHLASMRREAAIFTRIRGRVAAAVVASAGSAGVAPDALSREDLVDALGNLLAGQFDTLVFKLGVPSAYLSGATAPQATRSIDVLRWAEQANRLDDVRRLLDSVTGAGTRAR